MIQSFVRVQDRVLAFAEFGAQANTRKLHIVDEQGKQDEVREYGSEIHNLCDPEREKQELINVGEPPHVAQAHRVAHRRQNEVQPPAPCGSLRLRVHWCLVDPLQVHGSQSIVALASRHLCLAGLDLHRVAQR
ncbi:hypothetical protein EYF80_038613 [Liparis tanakae]|uniref:Uncharacterized protein n=1 Tax=Liparis tanakae TaxID=230148 RepID=A0A4Z2GDI7_9TELE|nr:hypothetical protein EYF80_038613 [Liparis tanakae]